MSATIFNSLMNAGAPTSPMAKLPAELKLQIFVQCEDFESIRNLQLASREFAGIYKSSSRTIIKQIMERLAGSKDTLKAAVMAVEAFNIDPLDRDAVASFLRQWCTQYVVPESFYHVRNLPKLGAMTTAASYPVSVSTGDDRRHHSYPALYTLSQCHQMMRSLLRMETARRLFHDRLPDGQFLFNAPFPELEKKYWRSLTSSEFEDLAVGRTILSLAFRRALESTRFCPQGSHGCVCLGALSDWDTTVRVAFSQSAGLLSLCQWITANHVCWETPFNNNPRINDSHFQLVNYINYWAGEEDDIKPMYDIAVSMRENSE